MRVALCRLEVCYLLRQVALRRLEACYLLMRVALCPLEVCYLLMLVALCYLEACYPLMRVALRRLEACYPLTRVALRRLEACYLLMRVALCHLEVCYLLRQAALHRLEDDFLQPVRSEMEAGRGEDCEYVLADDGLLWHSPRGRTYAIAVPKQLVSAVLALVYGVYGHPGTARTTLLIERKYHWPALKKDVRAYVLSCKCRRRKRSWSKQLLMMPPRLLQPWEVLEIDIQDMKVTSDTNNSHIDAMTQALDDESFGRGLERTAPDQQRLTQEILRESHEARNRKRQRHHAKVGRESPGAKADVGSLDRLSFAVQLDGRRVRQRKVTATDVKPYHPRDDHLRLPFEDEYAHLVWSADLGLADTSVVAVPLYTLVDRRVAHGAGNTAAWTWEYQGRFQDGTLSPWMDEDEASDNFSPLQLDAFHALYEDYHGTPNQDLPARLRGAPVRLLQGNMPYNYSP
ncbi:unnamed protein product [Ectocarpus sp. CCAP 1310/34]|nr:unnamed protein product [Ectocarpus sp. CCAP 1310/34]